MSSNTTEPVAAPALVGATTNNPVTRAAVTAVLSRLRVERRTVSPSDGARWHPR